MGPPYRTVSETLAAQISCRQPTRQRAKLYKSLGRL